MKKILLTALVFITFTLGANAQENPVNKGLGFGYQLNQYQKDFGVGLSLTSPYFAHDHLAVRMRGNLMYYEHVQDAETIWTPYFNTTLGLVGVGGYVTDQIRLYGEGGLLVLFPSEKFSGENVALGGYGLFGFEFFMHKSFNYFIEIGGLGTGATADKMPNKPIYSNGLSISTGFRVTLP